MFTIDFPCACPSALVTPELTCRVWFICYEKPVVAIVLYGALDYFILYYINLFLHII